MRAGAGPFLVVYSKTRVERAFIAVATYCEADETLQIMRNDDMPGRAVDQWFDRHCGGPCDLTNTHKQVSVGGTQNHSLHHQDMND